MKFLPICTLLVISAAQASDYQNLITAIEEAQTRVLVYAPSIFDPTLANALRRASRDPIRSVKVTVLSVPYYNYHPESLILSLAMSGMRIYEAQVPSKTGFVIVDGQGWKGETLARYADVPLTKLTRSEVNANANWFSTVTSRKSSTALTAIDAFHRLEKIVP